MKAQPTTPGWLVNHCLSVQLRLSLLRFMTARLGLSKRASFGGVNWQLDRGKEPALTICSRSHQGPSLWGREALALGSQDSGSQISFFPSLLQPAHCVPSEITARLAGAAPSEAVNPASGSLFCTPWALRWGREPLSKVWLLATWDPSVPQITPAWKLLSLLNFLSLAFWPFMLL